MVRAAYGGRQRFCVVLVRVVLPVSSHQVTTFRDDPGPIRADLANFSGSSSKNLSRWVRTVIAIDASTSWLLRAETAGAQRPSP